jgi:hypothetical protein
MRLASADTGGPAVTMDVFETISGQCVPCPPRCSRTRGTRGGASWALAGTAGALASRSRHDTAPARRAGSRACGFRGWHAGHLGAVVLGHREKIELGLQASLILLH